MKKSTFRIQSLAFVVGSICGVVNYFLGGHDHRRKLCAIRRSGSR